MLSAGNLLNVVDKDIILYLVTVFAYGILTLILMCIIQAALSSKTTNMSEAGNTVSFLMTITITVYFVTLFVITPYTKMSTILYIVSCIPLLSNYFIPAIMIIGQATPIQIIISLGLLIISIPITFKICAKIFKNGVLDYKGNKKSNKKKKQEKSLEETEQEKILKVTFRKLGFVLGSIIILWIAMQMLCSIVLQVLGTSIFNNVLTDTQISLVMFGLTSIISIMVPVAFISMYIEDEYKVKKDITLKKSVVIIFIAILIIAVLQIVLGLLYPKIGIDYNAIDTIAVDSSDTIVTKIIYFICLAVIPAIFEELLFRKMLINYTRKIGTGFAIIASSLIFALVHLNMGQAIFAFVLGLIFAIIYTKTGSIKTTMMIHFLNNGFAALTVIFQDNLEIVSLITIGIMIISTISLIFEVIKNRNKIDIKSIKGKLKINKGSIRKYKYLICDYTFIITIIITILLFTATENMLHMI